MVVVAALGAGTASGAMAALVVLRRRQAGERPALVTPAPWLVQPLAFAAGAVLLVASGPTGVALGTAWLLLGLAIRPRPCRLP